MRVAELDEHGEAPPSESTRMKAQNRKPAPVIWYWMKRNDDGMMLLALGLSWWGYFNL
jgi:hypothetical protein